MELSIVIPALEEDLFIRRSLAFLSGYGHEIIVCTAGREGDTPEICREFGAKYIHSQVANRAVQMNAGAFSAKGEVLLFLHADVLPPANFTQKIEEALKEGADFGCFSFRFDSPWQRLAFNAQQTRRDNLFTGGGDQCQFYLRSFFENLDGYRGEYVIMEDFELFRRAGKHGKHKLIREDALVSARKYEGNSYAKVQFANALAFGMFTLGARPEFIKRTYTRLLAKMSWPLS